MQAYHHEMDQDWHDANKTTHDEHAAQPGRRPEPVYHHDEVEQFDDDNW